MWKLVEKNVEIGRKKEETGRKRGNGPKNAEAGRKKEKMGRKCG